MVFEPEGMIPIQQSITDILDAEDKNVKESQNVVENLKSFMTVTALSFADKDIP